ncbi:MAG: phosphoribosylamine--glycine ligase, partial [Paramuribaculum sp.]|nr:phosphoribosylamine--glycine ligase [Paramuribaculum sp.]
MMVSGGDPVYYPKGKKITGVGDVTESIVFHAGTTRGENGDLLTSGGRVIAVSSLGDTIADALEKSFRSIGQIRFDGSYFRRDIGRDVMK